MLILIIGHQTDEQQRAEQQQAVRESRYERQQRERQKCLREEGQLLRLEGFRKNKHGIFKNIDYNSEE